jgi:acetylornithine deacetylase/succinyl-diaminopimelate desuccinylase-like protein
VRKAFAKHDARILQSSLRFNHLLNADYICVAQAILRISRRVFTGESAAESVQHMQDRLSALIKSVPGISLEVLPHSEKQRLCTGMSVDVTMQTEPWITDPLQPFLDRARQSLLAAGWSNVPVHPWDLPNIEMGTAGSLLSGHKVLTLGFGPGDVRLAHAPNESVELECLSDAAFGTAVIVHSLIGATVTSALARKCPLPAFLE